MTDVIKDSGVTARVTLISKKMPINSKKYRFLAQEVQIKFLHENYGNSDVTVSDNESENSKIWESSCANQQKNKENFLFTPPGSVQLQESANSDSTLRPTMEVENIPNRDRRTSGSSTQDIGIREVGSPEDKTRENVESLVSVPASPLNLENKTLTPEKTKEAVSFVP